MRAYPVSARREGYRGRDPRRLAKVSEYNRVAKLVEDHLNSELEKLPDNSVKSYFTQTIARELGEDPEIVHRVVFSIDCGHNGVTCYKGDYQLAMSGLTGN